LLLRVLGVFAVKVFESNWNREGAKDAKAPGVIQ
jgi:hypothetical protein